MTDEYSENHYTILRTLLTADGDFVSGTDLAAALGMSRPAVWAKLEQLKAQGFEVEAVRNKGYRITRHPSRLHPLVLRYALEQLGRHLPVEYHKTLDSTNSEADRRTLEGAVAPFVVAASRQQAGRGRLGRAWYSDSPDNVYLSVVFQPNLPQTQLQTFTLWAGVRICQQLRGLLPDLPLQVKWPNDLQCNGRKFAGMLTEAKMEANLIRRVIFGIGLNINSRASDFPDALSTIATSLRIESGRPLDVHALVATVIDAVCEAFDTCRSDPSSAGLVEAWNGIDALHGHAVDARSGAEHVHGTAIGINAAGELLVQSPEGQVLAVRAGEVTLRKEIA